MLLKRRGGAGGGGGRAYSFVACLSHLTIDHTSLSRRSTGGERSREQVGDGGGGVKVDGGGYYVGHAILFACQVFGNTIAAHSTVGARHLHAHVGNRQVRWARLRSIYHSSKRGHFTTPDCCYYVLISV